MPCFQDQKRVTKTLYLALVKENECISLSLGRTPPLCHKKPLTLCTCASCYALTKTVMREHGHELSDWVNEPGKWR